MSTDGWEKAGIIFQALSLAGIIVAANSLVKQQESLAQQQESLAQQLKLYKQENTFRIFERAHEVRDKASSSISKAFPAYRKPDYLDNKPSKEDLTNSQVKKDLIDAFNFFEEVSLLYKEEALDRKITYKLMATSIIRYYNFFDEFIVINRNIYGDKIWQDMESIAKCWEDISNTNLEESKISDEALECKNNN